METIKDWMRSEAIEMADELVSLNTEQFLKDNIGGFGLRKKVINLIDELRAAIFPTLYEKELAALGFCTEGGKVTAVPAIKGKGHLSPIDMLRSALRGMETENDPAKRDREVWWRMARLACRDAVKLGRRFEPEEAMELLRRLERCVTPYTCPPGRPTVFLIENTKLRDWFER